MTWFHRYRRLWRCPEVWVLTGLALLTRLWQLGVPNEIVFDEVYFRTFASNYLNGHYFFDIHPPLVKLLFASIGSLFQLSAPQVASGDMGIILLRLLPALAGAALVPLVYLILRQLHFGRRIATLGGLCILLDNALLVESRFVLMDSLLLLAGFGAISAYLAFRKAEGRRRWMYVLVMSLLLGALVSTKWTGLAIVWLVSVVWLYEGVLRRWPWRRMVGEGAVVVLTITVIYVGSFMVHFTLLNRSGDGDAYMSERFQSTLRGSRYYDARAHVSFWDKLIELNHEMYSAQSSLNGVTHPYASRWYSWPFMLRPIYYWQGQTLQDGRQGNIYLLGNPVIWVAGTISVTVALVALAVSSKWLRARRGLTVFLLAGYMINFVPFAFIDRPMFLYHYLFAFVLSILLFCVVVEGLFNWQATKYSRRATQWTYSAILVAMCLSFVYFLPLSYGLPLSQSDLQQHMWLQSWR